MDARQPVVQPRCRGTGKKRQRVRLRQKLIGVDAKAGGVQIRNECTIEIEGEEKPACIAETLSLLYGA